nr:hypothetical protein [Tanacetum cinerariifolium]
MNYLEEQTDGEAMINSIKNGDQPLPRVTQVSIVGTSATEQPLLKDKSMWSHQEKKIQKIDRLARSLLIQGLLNDIYSLIDNKKQEFVKTDNKKVEKRDDEKKQDMSKVKCYNCKKEGHFAKYCKKVKVKDYEYYKTNMLLVKKDKDEQVLLAEDQAWMESSSFEFSENAISDSKNQSENDCQVVEKECDKVENSKVIAPGMFKLSVSQSVSPSSITKTSFASKNVENLYTFSSVRRPSHSGVIWKKKGSSNTTNVDLSFTSSAYVFNDAMNVSCNSRLCDLFDENNLFIFDDESVRISLVSKMPFGKKPRDSMNVRSKNYPDLSLDHQFRMFKAYDG